MGRRPRRRFGPTWSRFGVRNRALLGIIGYGISYLASATVREPQFPVGPDLVKLIAEIDEFKGRWEALKTLSPDRLSALLKVATIESVGSSTRIEGAKLTDAQVETLLSKIAIRPFKTRDEQEVAGYAEAMDLVFEAFADLRLTENHVRQLHKTLLRHSDKDERHRGSYKTLPNHVVAFDAEGHEIGVVFETTTPFDTAGEMEELVAWTRKAIDEEALHPLLITAVFIVTFLAIHPFQDGNGRLSRVLTTLLLLRAGYDYVPYASLERVIEENKDLYYKALQRTQRTLKGNIPDWEPWIGFFLRCLKKQKDTLAVRLERERVAQGSEDELSELSLQVLQALRTHERLTIAQLVSITRKNRNTLKVRLRELVAVGRLRQHGKARATWYSL
jgi:Fic family protein